MDSYGESLPEPQRRVPHHGKLVAAEDGCGDETSVILDIVKFSYEWEIA